MQPRRIRIERRDARMPPATRIWSEYSRAVADRARRSRATPRQGSSRPMPITPNHGPHAAALAIDGVSKSFGNVAAVNNVSIDIGAGAILSLLGPSGCGKTTVLRIVAGLLRPERGSIRLDGEDVTDTPPHRRKLGMVFQNYALFPHMSVEENVAFGLKMQGFPRDLQRRMINDALSMVRMGSMASRFPSELSGGQQQRVSLARAVVTKPRVSAARRTVRCA